MAYFLKKSNRTRGLYLQIYESFRDKEKKTSAHKSYKTLGYYDDLVNQGITDPISYFQKEVDDLNNKRKNEIIESKGKKIGEASVNKNLGYQRICNTLNDMKIAPPKGQHWSATALKGMLTNVHYIGKIKWNCRKTITIVEEASTELPPIKSITNANIINSEIV